LEPDGAFVAKNDENAERVRFGTGQHVRVEGDNGEYVVVKAYATQQTADLLLLSDVPFGIERGVPFSRIHIVDDRRSPSVNSVQATIIHPLDDQDPRAA
jgi:hypothetical protein